MPSMEAFLREMIERKASDLHLTTDSPPVIRLHGELVPLAHPPLSSNDTKQLCYSLLTEAQKKKFEEESELDFSFGVKGVSRFRGNLYLQKGAVGGAYRIIDVFPPHQQAQVRAQLSLVLQAVISQQLIPRRDGRGRVLAAEVMIPNAAIRNLIREEKVHQIYSQMQVGQTKFGMQTMSQSLVALVQQNLITTDEAIGHATEIEEIRTMLGQPRLGRAAG